MNKNDWHRFKDFFIELNNDSNLNPSFLHRNKPTYSLIATIEMAYAFLMSDAYDKCAFYIYRAINEKIKLGEYLEGRKEREFIEKGLQILFEIKDELLKQNLISDKMKEVIRGK